MGKINFSSKRVYLWAWLLLLVVTIGLAFFKRNTVILGLSFADLLALMYISEKHYVSDIGSPKMFGEIEITFRFQAWQQAHKYAKWWLLVPVFVGYAVLIGYISDVGNALPLNFALLLVFLIGSGLAPFSTSVYLAKPERFFTIMNKLQRINIVISIFMIIVGAVILVFFGATALGFFAGVQLIMLGSYVLHMRKQGERAYYQRRLLQYYWGKGELVALMIIWGIRIINATDGTNTWQIAAWLVILGSGMIISDLGRQVKAKI